VDYSVRVPYKARNSTKQDSSEMCVETVSCLIRILTRTVVHES